MKKLAQWWLIACGLVTVSAYAQVECPERSQVKANYQIEVQQGDQRRVQLLELWRAGNQVALQYPQSDITELWEPVKPGRLHLTRYFDQYGRGIEYQSTEIKGEQDWSVKRQLVSDHLISSMTLQQTLGRGCAMEQHYSLVQGGKRMELSWLPQQQLVKRFRVTEDTLTRTWLLTGHESQAQPITQRFAELSGFDTTDYADVGDSESDPFLKKMINLGFIEHGATGFYDADGHVLEGGHQHHVH